MDEVKFAGTSIEVEDEVVAKITSFTKAVSISEEDVTGSEDVISGSDVLASQFVSIAVSETADVEGITIESADTGLDDGQSELKDAAETGKTVNMRQTKYNGFGTLLTGFFTSYEETADTSGVYKFKGSFRVNSKVAITPGS